MNLNEQLHSFTGTLTYEGVPVVLNYNRLTRLIFDKNISDTHREAYKKQIERIPEHLVTSTEDAPELLYFERSGDRYYVYARGPGRYNGYTLSMEGPHRSWSAYGGNDSTGFIIAASGNGRNNLSVDDLIPDLVPVVFLAGGNILVCNYRAPGAPATFTDEYENDPLLPGRFEITIINRNVAK